MHGFGGDGKARFGIKCEVFVENSSVNQKNLRSGAIDYIAFSNMFGLEFEWDEAKAISNARKHEITFEEAQTVFFDPDALVIPDPDHSSMEDRFIILGLGSKNRALVVVHCFRRENTVIRIISARKAGTKEQQPYWEKKR
jgi:uncharacterized protein